MTNKDAHVVESEAFSDLYLTGMEFAGKGEGRELGRGSILWGGLYMR